MATKRDDKSRKDEPRTDLPPVKEPYYEGYFGTDEEEGVVREEESRQDEGGPEGSEEGEGELEGGEDDGAGGDRDIS